LINALTGRKGLARASNTPGRTQEINYFDLGGRLWLVDLPGYGFAQAPKAKVEAWTRLVRAYLAGRPTLRRAFLLIDSRHAPKPVDVEIMGLLDKAAVNWQAVLTKADKPSKADLARAVEATRAEARKHPAAFPEIVLTSSEKGEGLAELKAVVASFL
jgi:GTP-binding protein